MLGFLASKTSLATLLALCALAAGVQALAPASAGAVANQLTDCTPGSGINGYGLDRAGNICYLGGGEVIVVEEFLPCANPRDCVTDQHTAPGEAGSDPGLRLGPGGRPAGPTVKAKPKRETAKQQWEREEREEEKERAKRLATMSAAERQKIFLKCSDISTRRQALLDRQPENLGDIINYYLGFQDKRAGRKTDWKYDRDLERQLPIYRRWTEATKRLEDEEVRAECWLLIGKPTKLPI